MMKIYSGKKAVNKFVNRNISHANKFIIARNTLYQLIENSINKLNKKNEFDSEDIMYLLISYLGLKIERSDTDDMDSNYLIHSLESQIEITTQQMEYEIFKKFKSNYEN